MRLSLKSFFEYKEVVLNFNYLALMEFVNMLVPFLVIPYLIETIGSENYGLYVVYLSIVGYIIVFINFGFNISEIKVVSAFRNDKIRISEIVSAVMVVKISLMILTILISTGIIVLLSSLKENLMLMIGFTLYLLDAAISPNFYFQGVEKMKQLSYLTIMSNLIFLLLLFLLVKNSDDYVYVPLAAGIGKISMTAVGLYLLLRKDKINLYVPGLNIVISTFKESIPFFFSRFSTLLNTKANIIAIGGSLGYVSVAYYEIADKIVSAFSIPFNIVNKILYPKIAKSRNIKSVITVLKGMLFAYVLGIIIAYNIDELLLEYIGGELMIEAQHAFRILIIGSLFELTSVFLGAPMLLVMGYYKQYNRSIYLGGLCYFLSLLIIYQRNDLSLEMFCYVSVMTSLLICVLRFFSCLNNGLFK